MRRPSAALIAASVTFVFSQVASAADLPVKAAPAPIPVKLPYDWAGLYVGGHLGYLWGRTHVEEDGVTTDDAPTNGIIGGVLAGYNWQRGPAVFGLEGDFGWTNANGTGAAPPVIVTTTTITQAPNTYDVRWTSHIRGRLGYALDNWLFYIAGGLAVADFKFQEGAITTTTTTRTIVGAKYVGWSIGGGVEVGITRNVVGRVEYLYDDFGSKDYIGITGDPYHVSFRGQTVRGALAWKFDGLRP